MSDITPEEHIPERVLVVAAHPDDIEFGAAGSVAKWIDHGAEVVYCIVTDGAAGSNDPDTDLDELREMRQAEQLAAAEVVGVQDVRFLGYQDGMLQPTMELRKAITRIIREIKPDRVVCQDPSNIFPRKNYINHPDHRAAGEAATYATFPSAETRPIFRDLLDEGLEPHKVRELYVNLTASPDTVVDISDYWEQKVESLRCHDSQLGRNFDEIIERIGEWNEEAGEPHGFARAEVFRVFELMRINAPDEEDEGVGEAATSD